jgi:hypothetical protein
VAKMAQVFNLHIPVEEEIVSRLEKLLDFGSD